MILREAACRYVVPTLDLWPKNKLYQPSKLTNTLVIIRQGKPAIREARGGATPLQIITSARPRSGRDLRSGADRDPGL